MGELGGENPTPQQPAKDAQQNADSGAVRPGFDKLSKPMNTAEYRQRQVPPGMNPDRAGIFQRMDTSRFADVQSREPGAPLPLFSSEEIKYLQENGDMPPETKARVRQESDIRAGYARTDYRTLVMQEVARATFPNAFSNEAFGISDAEQTEQWMFDSAKAMVADVKAGAASGPSEADLNNMYSQNHMERATAIADELSKISTAEPQPSGEEPPKPQNT